MPKPSVNGPRLRTDMVTVFIFRRRIRSRQAEFLQLLRADTPGNLMAGTWQPVAGGIMPGETAVRAALREMHEETGLKPANLHGFWQCDEVHPFYLAARDAIVLAPAFAAEAHPRWEPVLNREHTDFRWVPAASANRRFIWPYQCASFHEICSLILPARSPVRNALRIALPD